jgi:hypothetical protein
MGVEPALLKWFVGRENKGLFGDGFGFLGLLPIMQSA